MPIADQERWDQYVKINTDPYSKCCVDIARRVMELLDEDPTPLHTGYHPDAHTPHGIICKADADVDAGGITGAMAGAATAMVVECHSRGGEFRKIWNKHYGVEEAEKPVNPAFVTIDVPDGKDIKEIITEAAGAAGMRVATDEEMTEIFGLHRKTDD